MSKGTVVRCGFPFNYDQEQVSVETGLECRDKSRTLQSQAQDADINVIVKRFGVTGQLPQNMRLPEYSDFEGVFDFRTAMDAVKAAESAFLEVPGEVRARFGHDPQAFLEFCSNENNHDELVRLGLANRRPDPDAELVQEVERETRKDKIRAKSKGTAPEGAS